MSTHTKEQFQAARYIIRLYQGSVTGTKASILMAAEEFAPTDGLRGTKEEILKALFPRAQEVERVYLDEAAQEWKESAITGFRAEAEKCRAKAQGYVAKWAESLAKSQDPTWDLSSCDEIFMQAARASWLRDVIGQYDHGIEAGLEPADVIAEIFQGLVKTIYRNASYSRHRSTSQTSNLTEDAKNVALAELVRDTMFTNAGHSVPR